MDGKIIFGLILGIAGSFVGALLHTALVNHTRVVRRTNFIETHSDTLDVAFTNVEIAFLEFKNILCSRQRERIDVVWDNYNNENKTYKNIVKFHTYDLLNSINKSELREKLLTNIEKFLEFIKPK